jgi:protoporphyrinogen oxidase
MTEVETLVIGAGPAGLTTAYELAKHNRSVIVVERDPEYVGGISRTVVNNGYRFDIGGHRFFSKSAEIEALWTELLGEQMLDRPRSSRIYYNGKLFDYPLKAADALVKLGPFEAARCVISYLQARVAPYRPARNFEQWVINQFGRRLYEIFFKTYTEKVWGMDCAQISADWAAQRIQGLNLYRAALSSLGFGARGTDGVVKTLIDSFRYPRFGPGQMWERARDRIEEMGGKVLQGFTVDAIAQDAAGHWQVAVASPDGTVEMIVATNLVSSAAMSELVDLVADRLPLSVTSAARSLKYRDFLIVGLIARGEPQFTDNWVYVHDPSVRVGRIQNFKSWSPDMVPDPTTASYGLEYFCFEGDGLWTTPDPELIALATAEIAALGLARPEDIVDGTVIRQKKAYPVYDEDYAWRVEAIRRGLAERFTNLHLVGRNGMHKYNNQDHAMMTGLLTARNIVASEAKFDVWGVNQDAAYHEAGEAGAEALEERLVPRSAV